MIAVPAVGSGIELPASLSPESAKGIASPAALEALGQQATTVGGATTAGGASAASPTNGVGGLEGVGSLAGATGLEGAGGGAQATAAGGLTGAGASAGTEGSLGAAQGASGTEGLTGIEGASGGEGAGTGPSSSFGSALSEAISSLESTQLNANSAAQSLATGTAKDPESAVVTVEDAQLAMDMAAQIRTKATEAVQSIFQTQV